MIPRRSPSSSPAPSPLSRRLELKVLSHPANLATVRKQIETFALAYGFDAKAVAEIGLCVNEAMANVIRHAYNGRHDQPVHVVTSIEPVPADGSRDRAEAVATGNGASADRNSGNGAAGAQEQIVIAIRDWGSGVDPSKLPPRPYDPLEPGGVGLICLRQWLDEVRYAPQPDGGMLTVMKKRKS